MRQLASDSHHARHCASATPGTRTHSKPFGSRGLRVKHGPYAFTGGCGDHPELADAAFCGPAAWSPDGLRLLAADVAGGSILSVMADGSGQPIVIPLESASRDEQRIVAWQPIPR